jgi:hypothetical protein
MPLVQTRGAASAQGFGEFAQVTAVNYIEDVFSTYLYTSDGTTQTITNGVDLSTYGGLVWIKNRTDAQNHYLSTTTLGIQNTLTSNNTAGLGSNTDIVNAVTTTGFTAPYQFNIGQNIASWTFREQPKFFDVVTWSGDDASKVLSHNLGSVPGCIVVKSLVGTGNWQTWHRGLTAGNYIRLNTTAAQSSAGAQTVFGNNTITVDPTSTQFTVGSNICADGENYVAYLFAHDAGGFGLTGTDNVISCGSFTTDGSGNATVSLGYEPQWVMYKRSSGVEGWTIVDNMRGFTVTESQGLAPNSSTAEYSAGSATYPFKPTATGFQSVEAVSASSTYIYIAIRRGPMKVPTVGTSVFVPAVVAESTTGPNYTNTITSNFPVDLAFTTTSATSRRFGTRLIGNAVLASNSTAVETNFGIQATVFDSNISAGITGTAGSAMSAYMYAWRRAPSFFDVVCYTGTGSAMTVSHNLAAVPELIILKPRSAAQSWMVYAAPLGNNKWLALNSTFEADDAGLRWNDTTPTSSVFSVGKFSGTTPYSSASGATYVAYLFATLAGVSKVGSYTGTGTTLQIDCGFTAGARFVLIKRTDSGSTGDWYVWDSARGIVAGNDPYLLLNSTAAEVTGTDYVDTYNAGFEISSTAPANINASAGSFIFLAIA